VKVLVTGVAGFIGSAIAESLLQRGDTVIGIDNLNDYYDVSLKEARLARIALAKKSAEFAFIKMDIADRQAMEDLFEKEPFDAVINLAAQAGVRYSLENPLAYVESNITGFAHLLEGCRHHKVKHFVYASSSSIYGLNESMPFSVHDNVDHPVSLYAASKKSGELMAHSYSHLYALPTTGLRFFTVYGPWSRPDMAMLKFTHKMVAGEEIDVYNDGKHRRDFTYIDDIVEGVVRVLDNPPTGNTDWDGKKPDPATSPAPWKIYNIGNQKPIELMAYIKAIETQLGIKAKINFLPLQPGDVPDTYANVDDLIQDVDYCPSMPLDKGVANFVRWYKDYYQP
jgi:UDP-glucuronate 4-epimerase